MAKKLALYRSRAELKSLKLQKKSKKPYNMPFYLHCLIEKKGLK